jgi:hypothetical protein
MSLGDVTDNYQRLKRIVEDCGTSHCDYFFLSFFVGWRMTNTQFNYWTKWGVWTQLIP